MQKNSIAIGVQKCFGIKKQVCLDKECLKQSVYIVGDDYQTGESVFFKMMDAMMEKYDHAIMISTLDDKLSPSKFKARIKSQSGYVRAEQVSDVKNLKEVIYVDPSNLNKVTQSLLNECFRHNKSIFFDFTSPEKMNGNDFYKFLNTVYTLIDAISKAKGENPFNKTLLAINDTNHIGDRVFETLTTFLQHKEARKLTLLLKDYSMPVTTIAKRGLLKTITNHLILRTSSDNVRDFYEQNSSLKLKKLNTLSNLKPSYFYALKGPEKVNSIPAELTDLQNF